MIGTQCESALIVIKQPVEVTAEKGGWFLGYCIALDRYRDLLNT